MNNIFQLGKQKISLKWLVWFIFISSAFLILIRPHLTLKMDVAFQGSGSITIESFNTDRGEEVFNNYGYASHTYYQNVDETTTQITNHNLALVTNSLNFKLNGIQSMETKNIDIYFGPIRLKRYDATSFSQNIQAQDQVITQLEQHTIQLEIQNQEGWILLKSYPYFNHIDWLMLYGLFLLLAGISSHFLLKYIPQSHHVPLHELMLIGCPNWLFFMSELCVGNIYYISLYYRFLNLIILYILYRAIYFIFRKYPIGILFANLCVFGFFVASLYVTQYRNRPLAPWDFMAIGTALDVVTNYTWFFPYFLVIALLISFLLYEVMHYVSRPAKTPRKYRYYALYPIGILCVSLFLSNIGQIHLWDINLLFHYQTYGTTLTFTSLLNQYFHSQPKKPEGYSLENLKQLAKKFQADAKKPSGDQPDNIIMIMNESFADLRIGESGILQDEIPYFNSLTNTIRGNLYVDVRGGGTCNSEYEALTGNTTTFFADGVYAYNMYMHRFVPSLVSYFNDLDYHTTGIHLGNPNNWNRKQAYRKLHFKDTVFAESFDGLDTLHGYPTDAESFSAILNHLNPDTKNFIFNITYQNHGGYDDTPDLIKTVDYSQFGTYPRLENYISLIKVTDQEFKKLIDTVNQSSKKTMVIMFGDHQPALGNDVDTVLFPNAGTPKENIKQYITPFIIYANYDIPDAYIPRLSTNFLGSYILKAGNFQLNAYQQFLYELSTHYPVITLNGAYDASGQFYEQVDQIHDQWITDYQSIQYNHVFDEHRIKDFYLIPKQ